MDELDTSATTWQAYHNGIDVVHVKVVTINRRVTDWDKYQVNYSRTISVPESPWKNGDKRTVQKHAPRSYLSSYSFVGRQSIFFQKKDKA